MAQILCQVQTEAHCVLQDRQQGATAAEAATTVNAIIQIKQCDRCPKLSLRMQKQLLSTFSSVKM
jgi:hypothetical protein